MASLPGLAQSRRVAATLLLLGPGGPIGKYGEHILAGEQYVVNYVVVSPCGRFEGPFVFGLVPGLYRHGLEVLHLA